MEPDQELDRLRVLMDTCNEQLVAKLHERARLAHRIGTWKRRHRLPLADPAREDAMRQRLRALAASDGFSADALEHIFAVVFAESRAIVTGA